jgi:predicted cobalt transporter CbtA
VAPRPDERTAPGAAHRSNGRAKSIPEVASELWELTTTYAKQETIDPLKGLGRFLAFGVGGAIVLGAGFVLLLLAGLRALQTETGSTFTGNWSWAPYLIVLAAGAILIALALLRITKRKGPGA